MKVLSILVLLCSVASALRAVTCDKGRVITAAGVAVDHINKHHNHGYKFNLAGVECLPDLTGKSSIMKLKLNLKETTCHVINPTPYEYCARRDSSQGAVVANCNVEMFIKGSQSSVNKYDCVMNRPTGSAHCPDCPVLIDLCDHTGQLSIAKAVTEMNKNTSNPHYYALQETGRITLGYMFSAGMGYFAEFVLVETQCPRLSRIVRDACEPLGPEQAHYAFCKSFYTTGHGLETVDCEFYPPEKTIVLEQELCPSQHPGGPPPHTHGSHLPHCDEAQAHDRALHPICPWSV